MHEVNQHDDVRYVTVKDQQRLALNLTAGMLTLLDVEAERPVSRFLFQVTPKEVQILLALFEYYPSCCPYATVLAYHKAPSTDEHTVQQYQKQFEETAGAGAGETQMRLMRSTLSRLRLKIQPSGIDIKTVVHAGYLLDTTSL